MSEKFSSETKTPQQTNKHNQIKTKGKQTLEQWADNPGLQSSF